MRQPGPTPYRCFWLLGGVLIVIAVLLAVQGILWVSVSLAFAGVMLIILGYVERYRGAPPL